MNLTIKNIPDNIYSELKRTATENARSLNSEIVRVLKQAAEEAERRRRMQTTRRDLEQLVAGMPRLSSSAPLIRAERRKR